MSGPAISIVVPTRNRRDYLAVALKSLCAQQCTQPFEVIVVDDCSADGSAELAERLGARVRRLPAPEGLNAARNAGMLVSDAPLVAYVDDDVWAPQGWLQALVDGAAAHPESEAFGGPIRPRFDGRAPRACAHDKPPITALDLGREDRTAEMVWGANMTIRRSAWQLIGPFDEHIAGHGDEEEWLRQLQARGGRITYLAGAGLDHRRSIADSGLRSLARAAYARGRAARASDLRRGEAPRLINELRVLAGCIWHTARRRCPQGIIMAAHAAGRLRGVLDAAGGAGRAPSPPRARAAGGT